MDLKYTKVQTPRGVRDILPPEAQWKSRLEAKAAEYLERWGYARVYTPTFEFYDALAQGDGTVMTEKLYRFVDRDGTTLALRPEMTTPIARLAATRFREEEMPLRLYYVGSVFRYDEPQAGRHREFTQVGVELIGVDQPAADAEVVLLAIEVLEHLGLSSLKIDLGQIGYFHGLIQGIADRAYVAELKQALLARDYVRYEALVDGGPIESKRRAALLALPELRGSKDVLEEARRLAEGVPGSLAAVENLRSIYNLIKAYGLTDRVAIDLGMVKDLEYYSGLLLEGYTPELGFTLCTGGRYDSLAGRFGREAPATGFAFGVERAMLALDRQGRREKERRPDLFLYAPEDRAEELFALAAEVRARGITAELDVRDLSRSEALAVAGRRGIDRVLTLLEPADGAPRVELSEAGGKSRAGSLDEVLGTEGRSS